MHSVYSGHWGSDCVSFTPRLPVIILLFCAWIMCPRADIKTSVDVNTYSLPNSWLQSHTLSVNYLTVDGDDCGFTFFKGLRSFIWPFYYKDDALMTFNLEDRKFINNNKLFELTLAVHLHTTLQVICGHPAWELCYWYRPSSPGFLHIWFPLPSPNKWRTIVIPRSVSDYKSVLTRANEAATCSGRKHGNVPWAGAWVIHICCTLTYSFCLQFWFKDNKIVVRCHPVQSESIITQK